MDCNENEVKKKKRKENRKKVIAEKKNTCSDFQVNEKERSSSVSRRQNCFIYYRDKSKRLKYSEIKKRNLEMENYAKREGIDKKEMFGIEDKNQ